MFMIDRVYDRLC